MEKINEMTSSLELLLFMLFLILSIPIFILMYITHKRSFQNMLSISIDILEKKDIKK